MGVGALSVAGCASDGMKSMNDPILHDSMMKEWVMNIPQRQRRTTINAYPTNSN